jgi:glycosyltransferase involved in cell wall biosynthesis
VIEHGIVDPGARYTGAIPHLAAVINDPIRRGPVVGTDLLERFRTAAPLDLFGMQTVELGGYGSLRYDELHRELARRRVYLHTTRWTSLGLSLLEAMHLGMPVVALATTEIPRAVPPHCGVVTNDFDVLLQACRELCTDADRARDLGAHARAHALRHYGLDRFLADWDTAYQEVAA